MPYEFCPRLTAKIRRLGYPRRHAERLARFLVLQMMLVGAVLCVLVVSVWTLWERITGLENPAAEPFDVLTLPAAYGIHR